jgi:glycosyltransferase involved in cell wall biosynthesis
VHGARERGLIQLNAWLSSRVGFIDAIFVSRPSTFKVLQGITRSLPKIPVLFYGHDLHWVREKMAFESRFLPRTLKLSNAFWKGTFLSESTVWESADLSVYPSKSEVHLVRSWLKDANHGVSRVNNVEYGQPFWLDCSPKEYSFSDREGAIFVAGWQHPPNVEAALWFVNQVLPLVTKMINGFTITFAGSNMPEEIKILRSSNVMLVADLTKGELNARYERARVVVVPLISGAGIKLKVLEACAHGVPVVTTSVGIQGLQLIDNNPRRHDVRLPWIEANLPSDFASHLVALMSNEPRALELSGAGPQYIRKYFSKDSFRSSWVKLFSQVVTRGLAE